VRLDLDPVQNKTLALLQKHLLEKPTSVLREAMPWVSATQEDEALPHDAHTLRLTLLANRLSGAAF